MASNILSDTTIGFIGIDDVIQVFCLCSGASHGILIMTCKSSFVIVGLEHSTRINVGITAKNCVFQELMPDCSLTVSTN